MSLPLPHPVGSCLKDLASHFEVLQAQADALAAENKELKARLASLDQGAPPPPPVNPSDEDLPGALRSPRGEGSQFDILSDLELKKIERDLDSSGDEVPKQKRGADNSNLLPILPDVPGPPSSKPPETTVIESGNGSPPKKDLNPYTHTRTSAVCANVASPFQSNPEIQIGTEHVSQQTSIAASKLGMLKGVSAQQEEDEEMQKLKSVLEMMKEFADSGDSDAPLMQRIVGSIVFKALCMSAIAANTVYLGAAADHQVKDSYKKLMGQPENGPWVVWDYIFATWFSFEIALRILAGKIDFFKGEDYKWNLFDTFLVAESLLGLLFATGSKLSFLRIMRVFRLVRVVRVVRTVKSLRKLRTMIFSILNCFIDFLWATVVIALIIFVFGIIFDNAVASFFDAKAAIGVLTREEQYQIEELNLYFGSMTETMISLYCAITGGNDWWTYASLLRMLDMGDFYFAIFSFYIAFCVVALLNVVTGIFVDSAVCTRTDDEVVEGYKEDLARTTAEVRRIFVDADKDQNGTMCYQEFKEHLENPWVKAYFAGLDIDPSEAKILFTLIDTDGSDEVSIEEFVNGTMKLKGHAKSIDVISMMYDSARQQDKFNLHCSYMENEFKAIKQLLAPGREIPTSKQFTTEEMPKLSLAVS